MTWLQRMVTAPAPLRCAQVRYMQVSLKRERLEMSPVFATTFQHEHGGHPHTLGYIRLVNFGQHAGADMHAAIQRLQVHHMCPVMLWPAVLRRVVLPPSGYCHEHPLRLPRHEHLCVLSTVAVNSLYRERDAAHEAAAGAAVAWWTGGLVQCSGGNGSASYRV